ncbi:O-phosphoseryl-tRNA(Sec) selenium transferase-like [Bolinopsis microptera]|uniref:O-phosphoseryl-tRNA(Sec) selenium transferase-like n=1 Tax=Bolinopsis microptera TaxID=2820187 RepID=UPI00307A8FC5
MEKAAVPAKKLVGASYIEQGCSSLRSADNATKHLIEQRRLPQRGWSDLNIKRCINEMALMDSNNFDGNVGAGEREGRVYSELVKQKNCYLSHGMGRSGDIAANQPKAAGSALMCRITEGLVLDVLKSSGCTNTKSCVVLPVATGMALLTSLLYLRQCNPNGSVVIWPRIDQGTCVKTPQTAGCQLEVVEPLLEGDSLVTDVGRIEELLRHHGDKVLCVMSTTSCFAPRTPDKLVHIAELCKRYNTAHLVNNAYGIQCTRCMGLLNTASLNGRVDLYVQSLDKNFMVPVGGSIVAGFTKEIISSLSQSYPGRGSSAPILDLFITLLSMGREGFFQLLEERNKVYTKLKRKLEEVASVYGERVLETPNNQISLAFTLTPSNYKENCKLTEIGSKLFTRNVTGARVVTCSGSKTVGKITLQKWGSHSNNYPTPYITFAAAVGMTEADVDKLVDKFGQILAKLSCVVSQGNTD